MCRFILFNSKEREDAGKILKNFAYMCEHSKNFQGDGWGIIYEKDGKFIRQRSLKPIWKDSINFKLPKTRFFLAHARWAHGNWTLGEIKNNQPFEKENYLFVFNGNLKRVKLKTAGRIGAEKVLNLVLEKSKKNGCLQGIKESVSLMEEHSAAVKAINFLLLKDNICCINCRYNLDPDYFDLRIFQSSNKLIIVSDEIAGVKFERIKDKEIKKISLFQDINEFLPLQEKDA